MKKALQLESLLPNSSAYIFRGPCKLSAVSALFLCLGAFNLWWVLEYNQKLVYVNPQPPDGLLFSHVQSFCTRLLARNTSCHLSNGKWVPDPTPPLYTNETCGNIFLNQNCMKNGRPDRDFLYWRWQPSDCELPWFDPRLFLQLMSGKRMLFVGDSIARNHMESMLCALSQAEAPHELPNHPGMESNWGFPSYNFSLAMVWSTFLVAYTVEEDTWKIHLDKPDKAWTSPLAAHDIAVFSTFYWFFRRSIYYKEDKPVSSYDPAISTSIEEVYAIQAVWRTTLQYLVEQYRGTVMLRTVTASHFEGDAWDKGGGCNRTHPYSDPNMELSLPWTHNEVYKIQTSEFRRALSSRGDRALPILKLLDVTYSTLQRPDAHPGAYRIQSSTEPRNDCTHWCMPGAIDTWNQLIFAEPEIMCSSVTLA